MAIVSMVFGILAWSVLPFIGAIVAIVCGHLARNDIYRAAADNPIDGNGMAVAGLVLGYVQLLLIVAGTLLIIAALFVSFSFFNWHW
ncbi:MAG: DUF4190 domain-containing protein [Rhodanobacter sp.]